MNLKAITIRRTRQADLIDAITLVMNTANQLRRRRGMSTMRTRIPTKLKQPPPLLVHMLKTDPEGSFVAHDRKGKLVGFTMALIREDEWYLAFLFVDPSLQSKGLGQKLLDKAMRYGRKNGCKRWALVTFSYNPQAIAVYSKMGMPPQRPLLTMERKQDGNKSFKKLRAPVKLAVKKISDEKYINRLTALDRRARQLARPEEHFFWLADENYDTLIFHDGKKLVGYAVVNSRGMIAPVVASEPKYLVSLLALAVEWGAAQGHKFQIIFVQGEQLEIIRMLMKAGFHIDEVTLLIASEQVSDPKLYVPATLAHF
jgi:ribosomal protein S18 acetylase RimI-like enzyme